MAHWIYVGPHHDPHVQVWRPGMVLDRGLPLPSDIIEACIPPVEATPFEVRITNLPEFNGVAYAWRERWKTHLSPDPVASLFIVSHAEPMALADALVAAKHAFPEVWARFEKLTEGETCTYAPPSSAASRNATPTAEPSSKPAKASAKSSA